MITVCDREGDMYELFCKAETLRQPFLIRVVQNRMTVENKRILDEIRKKRRQGRVEVTIPGTAGAVFLNGRRYYNYGTLCLR